jgi:hypothetical protein
MAHLIPGKTPCAICGDAIAAAADAVGFPAFIPRGHEFERYSDCAFHRDCYLGWDEHDRFQKLFDEYECIWKSRPKGLSFEEIEVWGKTAFEHLFAQGMTKPA